MIIATETPSLRAPLHPVIAANFAQPVDLADLVQRAMVGDLQVIDALAEWDGQDEPPVGGRCDR